MYTGIKSEAKQNKNIYNKNKKNKSNNISDIKKEEIFFHIIIKISVCLVMAKIGWIGHIWTDYLLKHCVEVIYIFLQY